MVNYESRETLKKIVVAYPLSRNSCAWPEENHGNLLSVYPRDE